MIDEHHLWAASSRGNELQLLNLDDGKVESRVSVGVCPYLPRIVHDKVYVTNWGGDHPRKMTHGTRRPARRWPPIRERAWRTTAAFPWSRRSAAAWKQTQSIAVGGHPSGMTASKSASSSTSPTRTATPSA